MNHVQEQPKPSIKVRQMKPRVELSLKENFDLCKYLETRAPQAGESYPFIAEEAGAALNNARINQSHIMSRFQALGLKLMPAKPGTDAERIAALEKMIGLAIKQQLALCAAYGVTVVPELQEFAE